MKPAADSNNYADDKVLEKLIVFQFLFSMEFIDWGLITVDVTRLIFQSIYTVNVYTFSFDQPSYCLKKVSNTEISLYIIWDHQNNSAGDSFL